MEKALAEIQEFIQNLNDSDIHFFCNDCLTKQKQEILPDFNFHNTGKCEGCGVVNEVSVPAINQKLQETFLRMKPDLYAQLPLFRNIRSAIWSVRIGTLNNERMIAAHFKP